MSRLLAIPALGLAIALGAWLGSGTAAGSERITAETFVTHVGDQVRVLDAPIACRVVRVRELGGRVALDCRRGGRLAGTYGTLLTTREAAVVRFKGSRNASVVALAKHDGELRRCR